jgi:hypothetical protein
VINLASSNQSLQSYLNLQKSRYDYFEEEDSFIRGKNVIDANTTLKGRFDVHPR